METNEEKNEKCDFESDTERDYISATDDSNNYEWKHTDSKKNTSRRENSPSAKKSKKYVKKSNKRLQYIMNNYFYCFYTSKTLLIYNAA